MGPRTENLWAVSRTFNSRAPQIESHEILLHGLFDNTIDPGAWSTGEPGAWIKVERLRAPDGLDDAGGGVVFGLEKSFVEFAFQGAEAPGYFTGVAGWIGGVDVCLSSA